MKQTTKNVGKFFAVAMLSATVAGVTTYALMPEERAEMTSFVEQFPQSVQVMPTMFGSSSAGAMDLTKAAEASVNAVVHIKSTQLGKVQTVQQPMDLFDFFLVIPTEVADASAKCRHNPVWDSARESSSLPTDTLSPTTT